MVPTIHFLGQVYPLAFKISIGATVNVTWPILEIGLNAKLIPNIKDGAIDIECQLDREYRPSDDLVPLYMRALDLSRASVNIAAFAAGFGPTVLLHTLVQPNGDRSELASMDASLPPLCTAFAINSGDQLKNAEFDTVLGLVLAEPAFFMALNDLITSITLPHEAAINCARVVEGIRNMIAPPGTPEKEAWPLMRDALRISRDYLQLITNTSKDPRHGNRTYISGAITTEITRRAWAITNRFIEFRKQGNQTLSPVDFVVLS